MNSKDTDRSAYEEIWMYVVNFQRIPMLLQASIQLILNQNGLKDNFWDPEKKNILARIILAERDVFHLINIYKSTIKECFWIDSEDFQIIKAICDFIEAHISKNRNDLVHSFLFVDENTPGEIAICREKFSGKTWFGIKDFTKDHMKSQIEIIENVLHVLHCIYKNLDENHKVAGEISIENEAGESMQYILGIDEIKRFLALISPKQAP